MRYTTEMRFFAFRATIDGEVLEWDPPHRSKIRLTGLLEATVTSTIEPLAGDRSLLEHIVDYRLRGGPFGEIAARALARMGGAHLALRHGTLAQKRDIEMLPRGTDDGRLVAIVLALLQVLALQPSRPARSSRSRTRARRRRRSP